MGLATHRASHLSEAPQLSALLMPHIHRDRTAATDNPAAVCGNRYPHPAPVEPGHINHAGKLRGHRQQTRVSHISRYGSQQNIGDAGSPGPDPGETNSSGPVTRSPSPSGQRQAVTEPAHAASQ
jgi:hypothetical protein